MEPIEDAQTWAAARARELVAARLGQGPHHGEHPAAERWRDLLEETLLAADTARLAGLVAELCDLGAEGVEAREWLPKRPLRARRAPSRPPSRQPGGEPPGGEPPVVDEAPAAPGPSATDALGPGSPGAQRWRGAAGVGRTAALAILVGLVVRIFLVQVYFVPTASMAPTLQPGDRLAVDKITHHVTGIGRGDVVVFHAPDGVEDATLVKRVVAAGGDEVGVSGGRLVVDGRPVAEPYLPEGTITLDFGPVVVPDGHLFVLGDNRTDSLDSRTFGFVPVGAVIGTPLVRVWPVGDAGFL